VVDEERMRLGHWLGSVLQDVPSSALILLVGCQEWHLGQKTHGTHHQTIASGTKRKKMEGELANPGSLGKQLLKQR